MKTLLIILILLSLASNKYSQPADSIFVVISGDTIHIWNTGIYENCASNFLMSVTRNAYSITVKEIDNATEYATCMCNFDLEVSVTGYPPGNYTVNVFRKLPLFYPDTLFYIGSTSFSYGGSSLTYYTTGNQSNCYVLSTVDADTKISSDYYLAQNIPNPFNPTTQLSYGITQSGLVTLKVYNLLGTEVETLVNEEKTAGTYELNWNAANFPSGVYFYQLRAASPSTSSGRGFVETKKMLLIK